MSIKKRWSFVSCDPLSSAAPLQTTCVNRGLVSAESTLCATIHWGSACVFLICSHTFKQCLLQNTGDLWCILCHLKLDGTFAPTSRAGFRCEKLAIASTHAYVHPCTYVAITRKAGSALHPTSYIHHTPCFRSSVYPCSHVAKQSCIYM